MRLTEIQIERLLGFKRMRMRVDSQLQLIAGPNNSGKSSLVTILETFFSDPSSAAVQALKPLNDYYKLGGPRMMSSIRIEFGELTEIERKRFASVLQLNGTFWIKLECTRAGKLNYRASENGTPNDAKAVYEEVLGSVSFVKIPSVRVSDRSNGSSDDSLERLVETMESVLVRTGTARQTQLQREFAEAMHPVEELVQTVLTESVESIEAELPFREHGLGIRLPDARHALRGLLERAVITSKDSVEISIASRGTGFQSALVLGILRYVSLRAIQQGNNVIFAVEEPEAFLHPQTQRAMAKILGDISETAQLIVTTHSPVLVDSFSVRRITRFPLQPDGMEYEPPQQALTDADDGRLSRYCDAANSELVFANAVIFVEGHGDKLLVDFLLERITGGAGGHYALGITVIAALGIDTISHLVDLANLFNVSAYVLTDKDGVHKAGGNGDRKLLKMLAGRQPRPTAGEAAAIRAIADRDQSSLTKALEQQSEINALLEPWQAFVLSSDLEGLLLDTLGYRRLATELGPAGSAQIDLATVAQFSHKRTGYESLASWLGSKGWNSKRKGSGKVKPHVPSAILRADLSRRQQIPRAARPLEQWLRHIVATHERQPL